MTLIKKTIDCFYSISIKKKLVIAMSTCSLLVLLFSISGITLDFFNRGKTQFAERAEIAAEMLASNLAATLLFDNPSTAEEILQGLKADPSIVQAAVFNAEGKLFVEFKSKQDLKSESSENPLKEEVKWKTSSLEVAVPITMDNEKLGSLIIYFNTNMLYDFLQDGFVLGIFILIGALIVTVILATIFQRVITSPLLSLLSVAEEVSKNHDYSLRAETPNRDELGRLVSSFNQMLGTIEEKNTALSEHKDNLQTEVIERTKDLQESEAQIRAILESAPDGIITLDSEGSLLSYNSASHEMFLYPSEEILSQSVLKLAYSNDIDKFKGLLDKVNLLEAGESISMELALQDKEGKAFPASVAAGKVELEHSSKIVLIIRDISSFIEAQKMLTKAKNEAEASSQAKSDFLANMSHEIRTPMNGIIGMTELCLETRLNSEQLECMNTVKESAQSLLVILNDILDFSKIEAGRMEIDSTHFNLRSLIAITLKALTPRFTSLDVELLCEIDPDLPNSFKGDPMRIRQVLVNLIGNAAKFTPEGEVGLKISASSEQSNLSGTSLCFEVYDTGIGIPEEKIESIFTSFSQADTSTTRLYGGTGLGLSISSRLVHLMGGNISCASEFGIGSTFTFNVPLTNMEEPAARIIPEDVKKLAGLKVLVVDDNNTNCEILRQILSKELKMEPTIMKGGQEALVHLDRENPDYDLIISDYQMPFMDGLKFITRLRAKERYNKVPVLILSSMDRMATSQKMRALNVKFSLIKPVLTEQLQEAICASMGTEVTELAALEPGVIKEIKNRIINTNAILNILVAEDNKVNQRLIMRLLQKRGHDVIIAENGEEVLEVLKAHKHFSENPYQPGNSIDLIFMDIQMPIMGGEEASKLIRDKEKQYNKHIPIIALTAHALTGQREKYLEAGMDDYLSKPIQTAELMRVVKESVNDKQSRIGVSGELADSEKNKASLLNAVDGDVHLLMEIVAELYDAISNAQNGSEKLTLMRRPEEIINVARLISQMDGNASILIDSIKDFCAEYSTTIDQLKASVFSKSNNQIKRHCSGLQSLLENLCAFDAAQICQEIVQCSDKNEYDSVPYLLKLFEAEVSCILPAFTLIMDKMTAGESFIFSR